jgi:hypothetical protein
MKKEDRPATAAGRLLWGRVGAEFKGRWRTVIGFRRLVAADCYFLHRPISTTPSERRTFANLRDALQNFSTFPNRRHSRQLVRQVKQFGS